MNPIFPEELREEIKGPIPSFTASHILKAIILLDRRNVGRKALAKELGIGEGAVRTMLSRMKESGLIQSERRGCRLSEYGLKVYERLSSILKVFYGLKVDYAKPYNVAILLKGGARLVKRGLEERDHAIIGGAEGASLFIVKGGDIWMPGLENISSRYSKLDKEIRNKIGPEEDDVVILAWAKDLNSAEYGALNASLFLLKKMGLG